jgi:hypothetical protein
MKLYVNDIKNIDWLSSKIGQQNWGFNFLTLKSEPYFVFDYSLLEASSSILVKASRIVYQINDYIYKNMQAEHIGYIRQPFDTSNYLFYCLLKSACTDEESLDKLNNLFVSYKMKDIEENKKNLKKIIKGSQEINSNISFQTALTNIFKSNPKPIQGLCMVYDLIDNYTQYFHQKSIYGECLTKIVKAVKNPNGGLIPEFPNSKMRYLIVGELAARNDEKMQKQLDEAKDLFRSGNTSYQVYLETGWYFNKFDFKWRKRVSDDSFYFEQEKLNSLDGASYFIPKGFDPDPLSYRSMISGFLDGNPTITNLIIKGYDGKIKDYISFEEAYKLYPDLKKIISVFSLNLTKDKRYMFHFSNENPNNLVLIAGTQINYDVEKIKYVALHEIQHYVQKQEGFGNGGNAYLASVFDSIGGAGVKDFVISLQSFQNRFGIVIGNIPLSDFKELIQKLSNLSYKSYLIRYQAQFIDVQLMYNSVLKSLESYVADTKSIIANANSICFILISIYSLVNDTNIIIGEFITKHIGKDYLEVFQEALQANEKTVVREHQLTKQGWTPKDLYILNFLTYESLSGEIEARFTQQTANIPKSLRDYFDFYTSETIDSSKVAVFNEAAYMSKGKIAEAGIESIDGGKYIMHLPVNEFSNSINILHETGHILYDFLSENIETNPDYLPSATQNGFENIEEYFCASFVDYVQRKNIDPLLSEDISYDRKVKDFQEFDKLIDNAFYFTKEVNEAGLMKRITFVMAINNM